MPIAIDWAWVDVGAVAVVVGGNFALEICMICATPFVMYVLMLKCCPLAAILPVPLLVAWGMSCFKCSGHH